MTKKSRQKLKYLENEKSFQGEIFSKNIVTKYTSSQKQPPEVFCKKNVLKNLDYLTRKHLCWNLFLTRFMLIVSFDTPRKNKKPLVFWCFQGVSKEISDIKWVNKVAGLIAFIKKAPTQMFSCENFENIKNIYFEEHLGATAPECLRKISPLLVSGKPILDCKRHHWVTNTFYCK